MSDRRPEQNAAAEAEAFLAANADIGNVHIVLTDICGVGRGKSLRRSEIGRLYSEGRMIAGSILSLDITGADVIETGLVWDDGDADRLLRPVPGTLVRAPWLAPATGQVLVTMNELDDTPSQADPRHALARVVERFAELKLTPVVAVELEFYLLDRESALAGRPRPPALPQTGYRPHQLQAYDLRDLDEIQPLLADIYAACEVQGIPAETALCEYAPGQFEIVLRHKADALRAVDEAILYKRVVKGVAARHGYEATFMAKPYAEQSGSGMHVHISLADAAGNNAFAAEDAAGTPLMRHAIGGLLATMAESVGVFAPNANSYRRFRRNSYAPVAPSWGVNNRSVSVRVPAGLPASRHVEHRVAGADANPYLAMATALAAVHHGITAKLDPGKPVTGNAYAEARAPLPINWYAAMDRTEGSQFLKDYLGARFMEIYCAIKRAEQDRFYSQVTPLDFEWYLRTA
jgi:glutamine synthetase